MNPGDYLTMMMGKRQLIYGALIVAYLFETVHASATNLFCELHDKQNWFVNKEHRLRHGSPRSPAIIHVQIGDASLHIAGDNGLRMELAVLEQRGPILFAERPGDALWPNEKAIARLSLWLDINSGYAIFNSMWLRFFADDEYTEVNMNVSVYHCDRSPSTSHGDGRPP